MNRPPSSKGSFFGAALDLMFPPLCLACDDRLPPGGRAVPLCPACRRTLPPAHPEAIDERLARMGEDASILAHRLALWTFDDGGVLQRLQHTLKYGDRPTLGVVLGREIGRLWRARSYPVPDLIAAIPLSRVRFLERGYNQAERLATGAAEALGVTASPILSRTRSTRSQTRLSRSERRRNVDGAFSVESETRLEGRRVLLIDDVVTTGATSLAAAAPLSAAGAVVDVAALALTRD